MSDLNEVLAKAMVQAYKQGIETMREELAQAVQDERNRIILDLQKDAVVSTQIPVEWLDHIVRIVEG
jgi:hypothetical protein